MRMNSCMLFFSRSRGRRDSLLPTLGNAEVQQGDRRSTQQDNPSKEVSRTQRDYDIRGEEAEKDAG